MTDDDVREQLALLAVGALAADERADLEALLRERPDLQAELDDLRAAATVLADAAPTQPPPRLRSSVLDAIAATPQLPADASDAPPPQPAPQPPPSAAPLAPVVPLRRSRRRFVGLSAAAAAVVAIAAGALIVAPWDDAGEDPVAAVIEADDAVEISLRPTEEPGALPDLTAVHSPSAGAVALVAEQVPVPRDDRVYELWAIHDGTPRRVATFRPQDDGRVSVHVPDDALAGADQWAITEEPAGGTDAPTGPALNVSA